MRLRPPPTPNNRYYIRYNSARKTYTYIHVLLDCCTCVDNNNNNSVIYIIQELILLDTADKIF